MSILLTTSSVSKQFSHQPKSVKQLIGSSKYTYYFSDVTKDRRPGSYPISCKAVTEESSPSGIYYIKPDGYAKKFQVYIKLK